MKKSLILILLFLLLPVLAACGSLFTPVSDAGLLEAGPEPPAGTVSVNPTADAAPAGNAAPSVSADGRSVLRCALGGDGDSVEYEALTQLSSRLSEETGGRWALELYPGLVLGEEADTLRMLAEGTLDLCVVDNAVLSSFCEDFSILSAPYVFDSADQQERFYEAGDLAALFEAPASSGFTVLCAWSAGTCNLITRDAPVSSPADMAGLTVGVLDIDRPFSPLHLMGSGFIGVREQDRYTALQIGIIGGAECEFTSYTALEYWTVAPYYNLTGHRFLTNELAVANQSLGAMSAEDRAALSGICRDFPLLCHGLYHTRLSDCENRAEACGIVITEADRPAFRALCEEELLRVAGKTELTKRVYDQILSLPQSGRDTQPDSVY